MDVDVNVTNLDIKLKAGEKLLYYNHHHIYYTLEKGVMFHCLSCSETVEREFDAPDRYKWEVLFYELGKIDSCEHMATDVGDLLQTKVLSKYVGRPNTANNRQRIQHDIRNLLGDDVTVDVT